jgi:hypothetical protein
MTQPDTLTWRKSTYSGGQSIDCVEVANTPAFARLRDSKNTTGPALTITPTAFTALLDSTHTN